MAINKLTHSALRAAKPAEKPYKLSDDGGLYLLVNPNGASQPLEADERQHGERRAAVPRLHERGDDRPRIPVAGVHVPYSNEQGYHPDLIELQLAHAERNKVRAAYNKAQRVPERRKMMQAWVDYLDQLRRAAANSNVLPMLAGARAARAVNA